MKGYVETIGWTLFVLITIVFVFFIVIIGDAWLRSTANNNVASADFVAANSQSSALASTLAYLLTEDRQFIEQANEIALTSVDKSSSSILTEFLDSFMRSYRRNAAESVDFVIITVYNETDQKFEYTNAAKTCGDNLEGFCLSENIYEYTETPHGRVTTKVDYNCGKGRTRIDDAHYTKQNQRCSTGICCVEQNPYPDDVFRCGSSLDGVCDTKVNTACLYGRVKIEDTNDICKNNGRLVCCLPVAEENFRTGTASRAEIPLLYNQSLGRIVVTIG